MDGMESLDRLQFNHDGFLDNQIQFQLAVDAVAL
jgi:hypothetical protein